MQKTKLVGDNTKSNQANTSRQDAIVMHDQPGSIQFCILSAILDLLCSGRNV